jgi:hypothetical protein
MGRALRFVPGSDDSYTHRLYWRASSRSFSVSKSAFN